MAQDNVQRIKERLDIVDVIGSKVELRRAGRYFKGRCPFHQEKTPSFVVYPDNQSYHCFGCQKNGDIFSFLMETENLTFRDALEQLAQRAGITIESNRPANPERDERRQRLIDLNERAAAYFSSVLWNSSAGQPARELVERRGVDRKTAEIFALGFAPDSWDALKTHLQQQLNVSEDQLVDAGLCSKADSGRVYDRFRNRLMFPIRDRKGRTIGFGARALGGEMPKYLNSPQTALFDKSATLYALDRAFEEIRKTRELVVVEGYMDAIAAHQFGFSNAVASMGTALTEAQVMAIRSYVDKVYVALDSDAAGQMATIRAIDTLREGFSSADGVSVDPRGLIRSEHSLDAEIRVVLLAEGKDPDDLIRTDPALWEAALGSSLPLVEYILKTRLSDVEDSPTARAEALRTIAVPVLREVRDETVQARYIDMTAALLRLKDSSVKTVLSRASRKSKLIRDDDNWNLSRPSPGPETDLLARLLFYPLGYAHRAGTLELIDDGVFRETSNREILALLRQYEFDADRTIASLDPELAAYCESLRSLVSQRDDLSPGMANNDIIGAVEHLHRSRYEEQVHQTQRDLQFARENGDSELLRESLTRMAELVRDKSRYDPKVSPYFQDLRSTAD